MDARKGYHLGVRYEVRYPCHLRADDDCYDVTTQTREHVVAVSNGPTNLKYDGADQPMANEGQKMTMPDERALALIRARELLVELSQSRTSVDTDVLRERAKHVLRHYPDNGMVALIAMETVWLDMPRRI